MSEYRVAAGGMMFKPRWILIRVRPKQRMPRTMMPKDRNNNNINVRSNVE